MAIEVFNRHENKYLLDQETYCILRNRLSEYMELDSYNASNQFYTIRNLYYDTEDDYLIQCSLAKPKYKEKLRLRTYEIPQKDSKVYVEIKKKYEGLVNKRRCGMGYQEALEFLESRKMPSTSSSLNVQVLHEIDYLLSQHELKPKLYLSYDRIAYFGKEQKDLRISFDCNILTRRVDLDLSLKNEGDLLLPEGTWLMEIKALDFMPEWLIGFLSQYKIYPVSFSKYGQEYTKFINSQDCVFERKKQRISKRQICDLNHVMNQL